MIHNDRQHGQPAVLFRDTKANIEAFTGLEEGAAAYAADTDELGTYDGAAWTWGRLTSAHRYRQFLYVLDGMGDFVFLTDDDGHPLMGLLDLEA